MNDPSDERLLEKSGATSQVSVTESPVPRRGHQPSLEEPEPSADWKRAPRRGFAEPGVLAASHEQGDQSCPAGWEARATHAMGDARNTLISATSGWWLRSLDAIIGHGMPIEDLIKRDMD